MTTKPQIGRNVFNQELVRSRQAAEAIREALAELTENPGPQTRNMLIAKAALNLSKIQSAIDELDKIGREAKNSTLKTE